MLHLPAALLRPALSVSLLGLELPQVRAQDYNFCKNKSRLSITCSMLKTSLFFCFPLRAGFARQGAKEKQLLKEGNAFNVSPFVLRAMMSGQYWPEGDEVYHAELTVPILLVHGMHDKFVPIDEDQRMAEVCVNLHFFCDNISTEPSLAVSQLTYFYLKVCTLPESS